MEKIINSTKMFFNNENDKIMFIIEHVFNAKNLETAVTMEQVIEKGIEMNLCETYPRGKEDGHPWYPHTSTMCGIHPEGTLNGNYEPYLHRAFVKRNSKKSKVFVYWVDKTKKAEVIGRNGKPVTRQAKVAKITPDIIRETRRAFTREEMDKRMEENPGMYVIFNDKLYMKDFVIKHPEKFGVFGMTMAAMNN